MDTSDIVERLRGIEEELRDLAYDRLREAAGGDEEARADERRVLQARRAIERAIRVLDAWHEASRQGHGFESPRRGSNHLEGRSADASGRSQHSNSGHAFLGVSDHAAIARAPALDETRQLAWRSSLAFYPRARSRYNPFNRTNFRRR